MYIDDIENYGVTEYYATLNEFFRNKGGDCEDFAIAKYNILVNEFNIPKESLSFIVVKIRKRGIEYHMVLKYSKDNNDIYLDLDSDINFKYRWKQIGSFSIEEINERIQETRITTKI